MQNAFPPDIRELVERQMSPGPYASEDQLFCEALTSLADESSDLAAIQESITALEAGDEGTPYNEVFDRIQEKHSIGIAT